jgi:hypothetical protein
VAVSTNHQRLARNPELGALADVPLDMAYRNMSGEQIEAFSIAFSRFGIDPQEVMDESSTLCHSLEYIARWINTWDVMIPTLASCPLKQNSSKK